MTQTNFFDRPPAQPHSATSLAAAQSIEPAAGTLRAVVLDAIRKLGEATDEEIQDFLSMNPSTERPRRIELWKAGLIEDSGHTRQTKSGRAAAIWRAM